MKITIIELLKKLSLVKHLSLKDWESILSDAREQKVVGRLCYLLKKESLFFKINNKSIADLAQFDIIDLANWFKDLDKHLSEKQKTISSEILKEILTSKVTSFTPSLTMISNTSGGIFGLTILVT